MGVMDKKKNFSRNFVSPVDSLTIAFSGAKGTKSFVDHCISYVGENAAECVKTNSFLNLPKDALIKLVSSDCVSTYVAFLRMAHQWILI